MLSPLKESDRNVNIQRSIHIESFKFARRNDENKSKINHVLNMCVVVSIAKRFALLGDDAVDYRF